MLQFVRDYDEHALQRRAWGRPNMKLAVKVGLVCQFWNLWSILSHTNDLKAKQKILQMNCCIPVKWLSSIWPSSVRYRNGIALNIAKHETFAKEFKEVVRINLFYILFAYTGHPSCYARSLFFKNANCNRFVDSLLTTTHCQHLPIMTTTPSCFQQRCCNDLKAAQDKCTSQISQVSQIMHFSSIHRLIRALKVCLH